MRRALAILFLLIAVSANAATYLVRDGGDGSSATTSWAGAYDQLTSAEAAASRGDTIYVADGSYTSPTLNVANSGSTLITIKKATVADHGTSTGWDNAYGDGQAVFSGRVWVNSGYWVIDGQSGGGPGSWKSGHGFKIAGSVWLNQNWPDPGTEADNITLRHCEIDGATTSGSDPAISAVGSSGLTLSHLWTHDTAECFVRTTDQQGLLEVSYCYVGDFCHSCSTEIHGEIISWKDSGSMSFHHNLVRDCGQYGPAGVTGGLMIQNAVGETIDVYGNVFYRESGVTWTYAADGFIGPWTGYTEKVYANVRIFNNTFINVPLDAIGPAGGVTYSGYHDIRNNYFYDTDTGLPNGIYDSDYNHSQDSGDLSEANDTSGTGSPFVTLTDTSDNFAKLSADTAAGDTGVSATYRTDWWGNVGNTRGALQFSEGGSPAPGYVTNFNANTVRSTTLRVR